MDDGALIQYKNVEIHQQALCVLSEIWNCTKESLSI